MALAVKVFSGVLGGGTVAVGGCGVYSVATGKPILFFKGSEKVVPQSESQSNASGSDSGVAGEPNQPAADIQNPPAPNTQAQESQTTVVNPPVTPTNRSKIEKLIEDWKGKCVLKVKLTSSEEAKDISAVDNDTSLEGLDAVLSTKTTSLCPDNQSPEKTIVFEKGTDSSWINTDLQREEIKTWIEGFKEKCTVTFTPFGTPATPVTIDVKEKITDQQVGSIHANIKTLKEGECASTQPTKKTIVFTQATDGGTWSYTSSDATPPNSDPGTGTTPNPGSSGPQPAATEEDSSNPGTGTGGSGEN